MVKNIIVIEVEVDELHEGKILSRPSTSMEIKEIKRGLTELCHTWNQTKNCPLLQYNRGHIMRQGGHMLLQENKENKKSVN